MVEDKYECERCTFGTEGGVCAIHGVEVERRKNVYEGVEGLRKSMDSLTVHIGGLLTFKNIMLGIGMLGMLVLCGSFYFTADTKKDLTSANTVTNAKLEIVTSQVMALTTAVAVTEARHNAVLMQLESLTQYMKMAVRESHSLIPDPKG